MSEAVCDDVKFKRVNMLLEAFNEVNGNLVYEWNVGAKKYTVSIIDEDNSTAITFSNNKEVNEKFNSIVAFKEYCDTYSKTMMMNEQLNFMKIKNWVNYVHYYSSY